MPYLRIYISQAYSPALEMILPSIPLSIHGHHGRLPGCAFALLLSPRHLDIIAFLMGALWAIDELPELATAELTTLDTQHETDGVHQIGLAAPIGANDGVEGAKRPDGLLSPVRLEVLDLNAYERHDEPLCVSCAQRDGREKQRVAESNTYEPRTRPIDAWGTMGRVASRGVRVNFSLMRTETEELV